MMILRTTLTSPFGRKVRIAAALLGLQDKITIIEADTRDVNDNLRQQNPLGKIPTLVLGDGKAIYDSRVIVQFLQKIANKDFLIPNGDQQIDTLIYEALADGLMDAAVIYFYEFRFRPKEHHVASWLDHQQGKIDRALVYAEEHHSDIHNGLPNIGDVSLACALSFLDARFEGKWREIYPRLVAWLKHFETQNPSFSETAPPQ